MNKYIVYQLLLLFLPFFCFSQTNIKTLLDSLNTKKIIYHPGTIDDFNKSKLLFAQIDTTQKSSQNINLITDYYKAKTIERGEEPFPLLMWSLKTSKTLNHKEGEVNTLMELGDAYRALQDIKAIDFYKEALRIYKKNKNQLGIINVNKGIALSYYSTQEYHKSIELFLQSIEILEKTGDYHSMIINYHNLGDTYLHTSDTIKAIEYIQKSSILEKKYPDIGIRSMNNYFLGEIFLNQGNISQAEKYFNDSNDGVEDGGYLYLRTYNNIGLGKIEELKGNLNKALNYYIESFKLNYNAGNSEKILFILSTHIANILILKVKYDDALYLLNSVEEKVLKDKSGLKIIDNLYYGEQSKFYEMFSLAFEGKKNFKSANAYRILQLNTVKKENETLVLKEIKEVEGKYKFDINEKEIQLLKDENNIKYKGLIISGLLFFIILLLFFFSIKYHKQKSKNLKRKIEIDDLSLKNERVKGEKLIAEKEINRLELELKEKELTTNSISLLQKKTQFDSILNSLNELKVYVSNNEGEDILQEIISNCSSSNISYNWDEFKLTFEKVHKNFYKKLYEKHSNLSTNEKRICAFLKLGMQTKDIASITLQSSRTIIMARSRLRKKLGLDKDVNLVNYIDSF